MKRVWTLVAAAAIAAASFSGVARAQDKKTITIWHGWQGAYAEAIQAVFDEYNANNTDGVTVELSNPGDLNKSLEVAIPAGEGPDIISWANDVIGKNVLIGNIVPLNDYGIDSAYVEGMYEPAAVKGITYNGQVWALPEAQEGVTLICNGDVVKEEDLPSDPADFDGLLAAAQKFREANPDKYLIYNQGLGGSDAYHAAPVWHGFGAFYVDETGAVGLNTEAGAKAAAWLAEFAKVSPKEADGQLALAAVTGGEAGCMWTGPWSLADFKKAGINYFIHPFGSPFVGIKVQMLTINAVERGNAEAAVKVMQFFDSAEVQAKLSAANSTIPAATEALKNEEVANNPDVIAFGEQFAVGVPFPNTPYMDCLWGPAADTTVAIWSGAQTPEEALAGFQTAIDESSCMTEKREQIEALATPAQ